MYKSMLPCADSSVCLSLQPYVDLATGNLHVYSVGMYLWTADATNASAPVNATSISCEAAGASPPPSTFTTCSIRHIKHMMMHAIS